MTHSETPTDEAALDSALQSIAQTPTLLVALDFDGTLAPEVDSPGAARAIPEAVTAIERLLAMPHTRVALISGRAAASLIEVARPARTVLLVGSHGVETRLDTADVELNLTAEDRTRVAALRRTLDAAIDGLAHVWIETKPAGFAVHTRLATADDTRTAHERVLAGTAMLQPLTMRSGKNVIEFSVREDTKGDAVRRLRDHTGATAVFFAGDDVTDEDGFAALGAGDLGMKIGEGDTHANVRVSGPADVAQVLHRLADLRAASADTPASDIR